MDLVGVGHGCWLEVGTAQESEFCVVGGREGGGCARRG